MRTSESVDLIAAALVKAQGAMGTAKKAGVNPHFQSSFTRFSDIVEAVRAPYLENGIAIVQDVTCEPTQSGGWVGVTTRFQHVSGQWMEFGPLSVLLAKPDAQSVGSATSYGKRYSLGAASGAVADEDDDGEKAQQRDQKPARSQSRPATQKPFINPATIEALQKAGQRPQEPVGAPPGDPAALSLADQVQFAADSLSTLRNGMPSSAIIADASRFDGEKGPVQFENPKRVKSEKWLKSTLTKLEKWLHDAKMGSEPGADEGAEWLSDGPVSGGQKDGFTEEGRR